MTEELIMSAYKDLERKKALLQEREQHSTLILDLSQAWKYGEDASVTIEITDHWGAGGKKIETKFSLPVKAATDFFNVKIEEIDKELALIAARLDQL